MNRRILFSLAGLFLATAAEAEVTAIVGAKVYTLGKAGTLENATVLIDGAKVRAVGVDMPLPADAKVVDARGKVVTPGFFDAYGRLGVLEVELEDSTVDFASKDHRYSAAFDVVDAINPRSPRFAITRIEGVTRALVAPDVNADDKGYGPVIAGRAAAIHLGATEGFVVRGAAGLVVKLGEGGKSLAGGARGSAFLRLREALDDARDYGRNRDAYFDNARRAYGLNRLDLEALQPVLRGDVPVLAEAHRASDIRAALRLASEFRLKLAIIGGSEAWIVAEELARANVPVVLDVMENLPSRFEALGSTLENAARLDRAGVKLAFATADAGNPRNVKQLAGNAVAYGLPYEAALAALSVNPARLYGVSGYGTLEAGMDADVVIWGGDPLEVTTFADAVWIRGQAIPMVSRQTRLRDRYMELDQPLPPAYRK